MKDVLRDRRMKRRKESRRWFLKRKGERRSSEREETTGTLRGQKRTKEEERGKMAPTQI